MGEGGLLGFGQKISQFNELGTLLAFLLPLVKRKKQRKKTVCPPSLS
jgi:hypothetical protein